MGRASNQHLHLGSLALAAAVVIAIAALLRRRQHLWAAAEGSCASDKASEAAALAAFRRAPTFAGAVQVVNACAASSPLPQGLLLELYAFYKQASAGACESAKPSRLDFTSTAKWEAWHALGNMSREDAASCYTDLAAAHFLYREPTSAASSAQQQAAASSRAQAPSGLVVTSRPLAGEEWAASVTDAKDEMFLCCRDGKLDRLQQLLGAAATTAASSPDDGACSDIRNEAGETLLHAAADAGHVDIVSALLVLDPHLADCVEPEQGQTALHYAAALGNSDVVRLLVLAGASTALADLNGDAAAVLTNSQEIRRLLRAVAG